MQFGGICKGHGKKVVQRKGVFGDGPQNGERLLALERQCGTN